MKLQKKEKIVELPGVDGPGVAPVSIPEINSLCEQYVYERNKRCEQTPKEIAAKGKLIDALHRHSDKIGKDSDGSLVYRHEDTVIVLKPGKETLKVKEVSGDGGEEE